MTQTLHDYPDWQQSLNTADLDANITSSVLGAGGTVVMTAKDMRNYSSFGLHVFARQNALGTAYNPVHVNLLWSSTAAGARRPYRERYGIWASNNGLGAFASSLGNLFLADSVKGAWLTIEVVNNGPDALVCDIDLTGNSRSQGRRYLTNDSDSISFAAVFADSLLVSASAVALGAGATATYLLPLSPGLARARMVATTTIHLFNFFDIYGNDLGSYVGAAGSDVHDFLALPKSAVQATVQNVGGVAGTHFLQVVTARDNW